MSTFLTEADLAEELSAEESLVAKWRVKYGWPHIKIGRQVRYSQADLRAIQSMHHVGATAGIALPDQTSRSAARAS